MARILVAEDESSLAELVRINLADEGHEIVVARDGRFALQALEVSAPFDLLICDLMMPWADGFDVLSALGPRRPRVIVLTARDDDYSEDRAFDLGVDAFITKPYDPEVLLACVRDVLSDRAP